MPYSKTFPYEGSNDCYAKPITPGSPPSSTPNWAADMVPADAPTTGSIAFTDLTSGVEYWVYEKDPDNPVSANDIVLGSISDPASGGITTAQIIAAIKADADLGTAEGGMVANAAEAAEGVSNIGISEESVSQIVSGLYASLAGIRPTVSLMYDPRTLQIRIVDGDDWKLGVRTIEIPITLPEGIDIDDCTATFGAYKGTDRIDRIAELLLIEDEPNVRLTFVREDTLDKKAGTYNYDVEIQHTSTDETPVTSDITVLRGTLDLRRGIAKRPADIS